MSGCFVVIDGPDGAGKTTITNHITRELLKKTDRVTRTRELGGTPLAESLRKLVIGMHPEEHVMIATRMLLALTCRVQHVANIIIPNLSMGKIVISDRFWPSTHVYQGLSESEDCYQKVLSLEHVVGSNVNMIPNIVVHVTGDPVKLYERIRKKEMDFFESQPLDFHKKVNTAYHRIMSQLSDKTVVYKIDTTELDDDMIEEALDRIVNFIYIAHLSNEERVSWTPTGYASEQPELF